LSPASLPPLPPLFPQAANENTIMQETATTTAFFHVFFIFVSPFPFT
jgi:hypothetical protein